MPEPQADAQAELMAESFSMLAEKILTKDHFEEVLGARFAEQDAKLDAKLDQRFSEQDAKFDKRFADIDKRFTEYDAKLEKRFAGIDQRFIEQDGKSEKRFAEQDSKFENRFVKLERTLFLHTWMLGLIVLVLVVPQLQAWLA
ncbi:MAG: hypothetical protein ABR612_05445 [Chromatocurvus sp.]